MKYTGVALVVALVLVLATFGMQVALDTLHVQPALRATGL